MDEKTLVGKLTDAQTVNDVIEIANEAGKQLDIEHADALFGRINQTKNEVAELSGDTIEKIVKEVFGI
ncbi:hypothetical protein BACT_0384 [Bifidobacterium actinocoloniiforme DSM 22766]|uniref:Uncharacterized protein n=1 Tax=Bifidobacterium actinocoloniiforme DSM 22766 TaxID=1437605 RepID=A0A086YZI4_9BIFI|nr:hypothetical protein [Bifidobacterium actinocoloniiforme]AKV55009.1 hypothetical protein AB656_00535 [Bifidobacterium actinocoloniiforme DSM 22766]KFI39684.1 hypothetical protein BACT_0384 [Bifidobacterium actinocoloniiforme DSM 22766]